jgi:hypothetical protein
MRADGEIGENILLQNFSYVWRWFGWPVTRSLLNNSKSKATQLAMCTNMGVSRPHTWVH